MEMQKDNSANNKRIAKNTLLLYIRMLFIMAVQLFTSRVVLNTLGVVDYGLYNVVGGVVTMFAFLNGAMVTSTQRYITFELGRGDFKRLQQVFTTSFHIHAIISLIIVILGETVGLWFLYHKMVIPPDRMNAALWVFHFSIVTMVIQVMSVPYNSAIVAHERMGVFAAISILEVILKLIIVYVLLIWSVDKLKLYSLLIVFTQIIIVTIYITFCHKQFKESKLIFIFNRHLTKEIGLFAGWSLIGNTAATLYSTGVNLLLNIFFGPAVNAARALAVQVETAITQFSSNFLMAVNPQITKNYAAGNTSSVCKLLYKSSKFSFLLLFTISFPLLIETNYILGIWLKNVPDYTSDFLRIIVIIGIIDSMSRPLSTAAAATGEIKNYQLVVGGTQLLIVPISYLVLKIGEGPISVFFVHLFICCCCLFIRLLMLRKMIGIDVADYIRQVIFKCLLVVLASIVVCYAFITLFPQILSIHIYLCLFSLFFVILFSFFIGLTEKERVFVKNEASKFYFKMKNYR